MPSLAFKSFELRLAETFTISRGSIDTQPTTIVQLSDGDVHGYGEATTNRYYGVTLETLAEALERVRPIVESADVRDLAPLLSRLDDALPSREDRFALCALDEAAHDLWGKLGGQPLHELWGLSPETAPVSNYTIGIDTTEKMVDKLRRFGGWPVFKIKLGTPDRDLEIIEELRRHTEAAFRVDANCGWSAEQTIEFAPELAKLGVEFIEQPLPDEQIDAMPEVKAKSVLPLVADESCVVEADVDRCAAGFHGVNVKLMKCGGLGPGRRMLQRAEQLGLRKMVGCMTESTVGISAIAQLAPMLDYVDMDGAALLAEDIAEGARLDQGVCRFPSGDGSGVSLLDGPIT